MKEWRKIELNNKYSVSNKGEVRNDKTGRILKTNTSTSGYKQVMLGHKTVPQYVHRLVAKAFIPNPENKPQVDHINGDKLDNTLANLRWVTRSENRLGYGYEKCNRLKCKAVKATHKDGMIIEFESRKQAAEYFKCHSSKIKSGQEFKFGLKAGWLFELKI